MKYNNTNKGFSLIELSIVLIIIGLLVAGITGGSSLIKSSEMRSVITEARNYKVAVNAYYTANDALPGDVSGNKNGRIEHKNSAAAYEGSQGWYDMKDKGIIDSSITVSTTGALVAGINMPKSKYKSAGWALDYFGAAASNPGNADVNANVLVLTKTMTASSTLSPVASLSPGDAKSIDTKLDDGLPDIGSIRGMLTDCVSSAAYAITEKSEKCAISIEVGM